MVSVRITAPVVLTLALLGGALGAETQSRQTGVGGRVLGQASPLAAAGVYAYQLVDRSFHKVMTDGQGNFLFQDLPAGLYQIIANKPGFTPVVVMLSGFCTAGVSRTTVAVTVLLMVCDIEAPPRTQL